MDELKTNMRSWMLHPGRVNGTWDKVQMELKCCGFANYTDWARLDSGNYTKGQTPDSCCKIVHDDCGLITTASTKNTEGCLFQFNTQYMYNIIIVGAVAFISVLVQISGVCCVFFCYGREN